MPKLIYPHLAIVVLVTAFPAKRCALCGQLLTEADGVKLCGECLDSADCCIGLEKLD